jgi:Ni,Fe-hydrogenase maturation factor
VRQAAGFRGPIEYRYQLQVEDAELISRAAHVVFVDACAERLPGGYEWRVCRPARRFAFSTHALEPGTVLKLCQDLYDVEPTAWLLAIEGSRFTLGAELSQQAGRNLLRSLEAFARVLSQARSDRCGQGDLTKLIRPTGPAGSVTPG